MKQPAHDVRGPVSIPSRANNRFGHIVEIVPPLVNGQPDHVATECDWGFFLLAGKPNDPTHGAHYPNAVSANGWVAAPDNVAFDPKGRIWISTDGQDDSAGRNDSLYAAQVSGPGRGATRCFFNGSRQRDLRSRIHAPRQDAIPRRARYRSRVEALEQTQVEQRSRICTVYEGEGHPDTQVVAWRVANDWPDDGRHPIHVLHVVYVDAVNGRPAT